MEAPPTLVSAPAPAPAPAPRPPPRAPVRAPPRVGPSVAAPLPVAAAAPSDNKRKRESEPAAKRPLSPAERAVKARSEAEALKARLAAAAEAKVAREAAAETRRAKTAAVRAAVAARKAAREAYEAVPCPTSITNVVATCELGLPGAGQRSSQGAPGDAKKSLFILKEFVKLVPSDDITLDTKRFPSAIWKGHKRAAADGTLSAKGVTCLLSANGKMVLNGAHSIEEAEEVRVFYADAAQRVLDEFCGLHTHDFEADCARICAELAAAPTATAGPYNGTAWSLPLHEEGELAGQPNLAAMPTVDDVKNAERERGGILVQPTPLVFQNIVARGRMGFKVRQSLLAEELGARAIYAPEEFAAVRYEPAKFKPADPKIKVNIFANGAFIIMGARTAEHVRATDAHVTELLERFRVVQSAPPAAPTVDVPAGDAMLEALFAAVDDEEIVVATGFVGYEPHRAVGAYGHGHAWIGGGRVGAGAGAGAGAAGLVF